MVFSGDSMGYILAARADAGLISRSITSEQLNRIAAGNAPGGIGILREVTELAKIGRAHV